MPRQLKCPKCGTVNTIADGARPTCAACGFGGAPGAAPSAGMAPAAAPAAQPGWGAAPAQGAWPAQQGGYPAAAPANLPKGMSVTAMVLGIASCCIWIIPYIGIFLSLAAGIVAIVLGIMGLKKVKLGQAAGKGMALTGLILGVITVVLSIILILLAFVFVGILQEYCLQNPQLPNCQQYLEQA